MTVGLDSGLGLDGIRSLMRARGVRRLHAKVLQANDNSKNQIYFGGDFGVLNLLPAERPEVDAEFELPSRRPLRARLNFAWLEPSGALQVAPRAKLILYPQYPEVRFSGYLAGVRDRARLSALVGSVREPGRVLLLGTCDDGRILGFVDPAGSRLASEIARLDAPARIGVFVEIPLDMPSGAAARVLLLDEMARIEALGWVDSRRLRADGVAVPYAGQNGGGYTLEAELGITPNSRAEPDFHGWEVKQHGERDFAVPGNPVITLMTPEPSGGLYQELGVAAFVHRYGYPDTRGRRDRRNFGGIYRCGFRVPRTRLQLELVGFDRAAGKITDVSGGIALIDDGGDQAAIWTFQDLIDHWRRKHAKAAYVASMSRTVPRRQYRYSGQVRLGVGTSIDRLLRAVANGTVFYDPGIKLEVLGGREHCKRRSQFRIKSRDLGELYDTFERARSAKEPA